MLRRDKGFTLIELLIVVAIIGIIAAIAVPNLLTAIQRSKRSRTAADIRAIGTALGSYQVDTNNFPVGTSIFSSISPGVMPSSYYEGATKDGWGTAFWYIGTTQGYTLTSYGKNAGSGGGTSDFDSDVIYINGSFMAPDSLVKR